MASVWRLDFDVRGENGRLPDNLTMGVGPGRVSYRQVPAVNARVGHRLMNLGGASVDRPVRAILSLLGEV